VSSLEKPGRVKKATNVSKRFTSAPRASYLSLAAPPAMVVLSLAVAVCLLAACSPPKGGEPPRPHVVLIIIDTLRADHTSVYGYTRRTTPTLERFAARGVVFETAYAPTGTTDVSHATLFTSRYPFVHGVLRNGLELAEEERTLAELLRDNGYRTAAFVSSFPVSRRFGFAQGFDHFDDSFSLEKSSASHREWTGIPVPKGFDRSPRDTTDAAVDWLQGSPQESRPTFLWVHYFDPHSPYQPPPEYAERFGQRAKRPKAKEIARYDAEIAYSDQEVGRLLDSVLGRGAERETLVIITADHGEGLWSHGALYHDRYTYEEEVRVPLIMIWEGRFPAGERSEQPAHLIDILPTIVSALGLAADGPAFQGMNLLPYIEGRRPPEPERPIFVQRPFFPEGRPEYKERGPGFGVRLGRWKFFEAPEEGRRELYDLSVDPREKRNLSTRMPEKVEELSALIADWSRDNERRSSKREVTVPPDALEGLRALGYVEGEGEGEAQRP